MKFEQYNDNTKRIILEMIRNGEESTEFYELDLRTTTGTPRYDQSVFNEIAASFAAGHGDEPGGIFQPGEGGIWWYCQFKD